MDKKTGFDNNQHISELLSTFVHEENIPLSIPVLKLISSGIQDSYTFDSATTLKIVLCGDPGVGTTALDIEK